MSLSKTHIALAVNDLDQSVAFYRALFALDPVKYKADYAKFDVSNPPLNLTLNLTQTAVTQSALSHLGIQVDSSDAVQAAMARFAAAGLATWAEGDTDCCYALQDKVWVRDPDGNRWEVFVVKVADTAPEANRTPAEHPPAASACCG
ncbi:MAG: ArsI/CadI family heavy metal resistance metalloenzyme [Cyanobacteria bacterium]|nr:ArsI/CadI family heavy metal resistance metalloenzyme [Cyanobacteriota bacterium]